MANFIIWYSPNATNGESEVFNYKDGCVFEENLNEQLDSGTIVLNRLTKHKFEPFDIVDVSNYHFNGIKTLLIDNVVEQQVSFEPVLYDYTITLMSKTKELERIVLPNISITKPIDGTARTLYQVIRSFLEDYAPKKLIGGEYKRPYELITDARLNVSCPDMQMSRPTLREAIDRVLSTISCICYVSSNNYVHILDINAKRNPLDLTHFNYKHENQSSADYASELDNVYNNVTPSTSIVGIDNVTRHTEYLGFRNFNDGIVTEDNLFVETKYPIYEIESVQMFCYVSYTDSNNGGHGKYFKLDITPNVLEINKYNTLGFGDYASGSYVQKAKVEKISSVYYTRGDNKITNFSTHYEQAITLDAWVIDYLVASSMIRTFGSEIDSRFKIQTTNIDNYSIREGTSFLITYKSQVDTIRAKTGKLLPETHEDNNIIDNPTESFVDIYQQGRLFSDKVNRLGNRAKVITGRFTNTNDLPQLGDYIDNFVVMNIENQYYDDFVVCKAILTENYVNINYFTGINARKRSWQIVGANEAFDKQLLRKFYLEFSFNQKMSYDNNDSNEFFSPADSVQSISRVMEYFADIRFTANHSPYSVYFNSARLQQDHDYDFIELELTKFISGNSIVFTFGMFDNFSTALPSLVRDQNASSTFLVGKGGYAEYWNKYTREDGVAEKINYDFWLVTGDAQYYEEQSCESYLGKNITEATRMSAGDSVANMPSGFPLYQGFKPRVIWDAVDTSQGEGNYKYEFTINQCVFSTRFTNTKDSRERVNFNLQFEYCTDTKDIVFTSEFIRRKACINNNAYDDSDYKIYISNETYAYGETTIKSGSTEITNGTVLEVDTEGASCVSFNFSKIITGNYNSIAIGTTDGKLVLAINNHKHTSISRPFFYLNLLQTRDRKIYTDESMKDWGTQSYYYEELSESDLENGLGENALIGWFNPDTKVTKILSVGEATESTTQLGCIEVVNYDNGKKVKYSSVTGLNEVSIKKYSTGQNISKWLVKCSNGLYLYNETSTIMYFANENTVLNNQTLSNEKYGYDITITNTVSGKNTELVSYANNYLILNESLNKFVFVDIWNIQPSAYTKFEFTDYIVMTSDVWNISFSFESGNDDMRSFHRIEYTRNNYGGDNPRIRYWYYNAQSVETGYIVAWGQGGSGTTSMITGWQSGYRAIRFLESSISAEDRQFLDTMGDFYEEGFYVLKIYGRKVLS